MSAPPLSDTLLDSLLHRLAQEETFVLLETTRVTDDEHSSLLFVKPVDRLHCRASDSPAHFLQRAEKFLAQGYYLAGWFAYEFGYLLEPSLAGKFRIDPGTVLADLGVYRTPHVYDHQNNAFTNDTPWSTDTLPARREQNDYKLGNLRLSQNQKEYLQTIRLIKKLIETGDTYQVNYTLKYLFDFQGSPEELYKTLRRNQSVSYGAYIRDGKSRILSFSPELFFRTRKTKITVRPMKGTMSRSPLPTEDEQLVIALGADEKNRSENVMIVDLLRNDLGRLCETDSVRVRSLFDVETFETVHQMTSTIQGDLRPGTNLERLFQAIFPCGSVTGAPKIRTMEIIRDLELDNRGVYTGAIGYIAPTGDAVFNVPIRTVTLTDNHGEMGIGSGIVYDSSPEGEWRECLMKARFLTNPAPAFQLIETLLWEKNHGFWLLSRHLERLAAAARYFQFPLDLQAVRDSLDGAVQREPNTETRALRVRMLLAKDGGLTVTVSACDPPNRQLPPRHSIPQTNLPVVQLSSHRTDSSSPFLYHKTTIRGAYDRQRQESGQNGVFEVLFCNEKEELTEGSFTNIFIQREGILHTPPVHCGLLNGTFRAFLLEANPERVRETVLYPKDLLTAEAVYVGNSVRGLVRVRPTE